MNIQWKENNADQMTFSFETKISEREVHYPSAQEAQLSPIASKIFGFPWTESIIVAPQSLTVEKQNWVEWDVLAQPLSQLIKEHIESRTKSSNQLEENPQPPTQPETADFSNDPQAQKIQALIDTQINPAVADHGGFVSLAGYKENTVYVELGGGCQGCAMSQATLKEGIAKTIMENFPEVKDVIDVTDHQSGSNPFYKD